MLEVVGTAIDFSGYFEAGEPATGKTGLTVTVDVYDQAYTKIVTAAAATEIGGGLYKYTLVSGSVDTKGGYWAIFKTTDATVLHQHVPAFWWIRGNLYFETGPGPGLDDTLGGIRWLLRARLNDLLEDGNPAGNYSTPVLDAWINLSAREIAFRAKCHKDTVSITLIAGQNEYDCDPVFEVTELALSGKQIDRRELLGISVEAWNTDPPGIPEEFTHRTGDKLLIHKTPNDAAAGVVTGIEEEPTVGGTGYAVDDELTLVEAGASGATVKVTAVAAGVVTAVRLLTGGQDYSTGAGKPTSGGTGNDDCTIEITEVGAARAHGYAYPPALTNDAQIPTAIPRAHRISAILEGAVYFCRDSRRTIYSQTEINEQLARWNGVIQKVAEAVRG